MGDRHGCACTGLQTLLCEKPLVHPSALGQYSLAAGVQHELRRGVERELRRGVEHDPRCGVVELMLSTAWLTSPCTRLCRELGGRSFEPD